MKQAVFFDIDGTMWDHTNFIPQSTIEGIHKLRKNGVHAFVCTGRSRAYVKNPELLNIGFDGIISGCGTMIEYHNEVVFYKKLDQDLIQNTVTFLKEHHAAVIMEGRFQLYVDPEDFVDDPFIVRLRKELGSSLLPLTGSEADWEVSKFSCSVEDADMEVLTRRLSADFDLLVHDISVMELVPKGCSKGTGILKICELLDIPVANTYAFGDSANDLPMFEVAGHSIAMGNASAVAKQKASYVTDDLHEDGIYHALEHFGLV